MELPLLLLLLLICSIILALYRNVAQASHIVFEHLQSQSIPTENVEAQLRTGYHFQPIKHWINDPNGPMFYNGLYHLFYQYNPKGAVWGNIVWAHAVSKDMINWKRVDPPAIFPSKPFDQFGTWSGSSTILPGNKPVILYTGIVDNNNTQVQNYAVPADPSDPYLRHWIKPDDNPIIVADESVNKSTFRDPTTAWFLNGQWRITIGGRHNRRGVSFLYKSKDFKHWVKAKHHLHEVAGTGNFECPDFFPVSVKGDRGVDTSSTTNTTTAAAGRPADIKYVFKVSLDETRYDYYTIGTYDTVKDKYVPDPGMIDGWNGLRYDYGNFYASKSFFDSNKNRRILWGWANESDATSDDVRKGWAGIQLIPRKIVHDPNLKQLVQWPIEELETLRGKQVTLENQKLNKGDKIEIQGITAAQADVDVTFSFTNLEKAEPFDPSWDRYNAQKLCGEKGSTVEGGLGPFGLVTLASENLEEYTPVFFRIFKDQEKHVVLMCSDASRSTLEDGKDKSNLKEGRDAYRPSFGGFVNADLKDKKISLRSLIDNSVVESFAAGGKTCITSRIYPTLAQNEKAHLFAFNNGTESVTIDSLKAWSMNTAREMNQ